ncbi:putative integral membrane protein [Actinacidiphila reveromycinica]|uniref:Putative integral membrane protein n=1 Tax=Actinacidiphila reveromycinica TaxID=659352 RepID=A0A7U3UWK8_9ACTN|nr:PP2C family protein-serine/threonine phosphatase [Streptomyces sp. SN-593]BBB00149.1 putative integral membrane protein [Streptomyces sp. SN-593]
MDLRRLDNLTERTPPLAIVVPLALVVLIAVADAVSPKEVYLSPMLVIAPALTASFAGPRRTAVIALVALGAQILAATVTKRGSTQMHVWPLVALVVLSVLLVFFSYVRERRGRQLSRVRLVAETAQRVLLRPPPERVGPLRIAWLYLAAEDDAQIGGDLFAVTRRRPDVSRVLIGDVRGKGLPAIAEASAVLGSFRETARYCETLPALVEALEERVTRDMEEVAESRQDPGEHFTTALVLELPDDGGPARMASCGHPPPVVIGADGRITEPDCTAPSPPLGSGLLPAVGVHADEVAYGDGDTLLLYTDGLIEARSRQGVFYPLAERLATFPPALGPESLLLHLREDLLHHTGGRLADDAALLAVTRLPDDAAAPGRRAQRP